VFAAFGAELDEVVGAGEDLGVVFVGLGRARVSGAEGAGSRFLRHQILRGEARDGRLIQLP
jgi:hypothetical protein